MVRIRVGLSSIDPEYANISSGRVSSNHPSFLYTSPLIFEGVGFAMVRNSYGQSRLEDMFQTKYRLKDLHKKVLLFQTIYRFEDIQQGSTLFSNHIKIGRHEERNAFV